MEVSSYRLEVEPKRLEVADCRRELKVKVVGWWLEVGGLRLKI